MDVYPTYRPSGSMGSAGSAPTPAPAPAMPAPAPRRGRRWTRWLMTLVLLLLVGGGIYYWQHQKVSDLNKQITGLKTQQAAANKQIADLNKQGTNLTSIQKLYDLPKAADFSPQCKSKDNSELIVATLTPKPVDNYQAYLEACANDSTTPTRVVVFKVKTDGTRSFAFGAGTSEPMCISSKIIDATAAKDISQQTKIPICKSS